MTNTEKLVVAVGNQIYCVDERKRFLVGERPANVKGLASVAGQLYDAAGYGSEDGSIVISNTLTSELKCSIGLNAPQSNLKMVGPVELRGLASDGTKLFAGVFNRWADVNKVVTMPVGISTEIKIGGKFKCVGDVPTEDIVDSGVNVCDVRYELNSIAIFDGTVYTASQYARGIGVVENLTRKAVYHGEPISTMFGVGRDFYAATRSNEILKMGRLGANHYLDHVVTKRNVKALAACDKVLYDAVTLQDGSSQIYETLNVSAAPLYSFEKPVNAMTSVPADLWENLASKGKRMD